MYVSQSRSRWGVLVAVGIVAGYSAVVPKHGWFGNENWNVEFLLIAAPVVIWWLRPGWRSLVAALLTAAVVAALLRSHSNLHWYVLAVWAWCVVCHLNRWIAVAIVPVAGLLLLGTTIELSALYRFELWWNAGNAWGDAFVFGHGLGSFDYVYDGYREAHHVWGDGSVFNNVPTRFAGAAHGLPVQIAVEFGIAGIVLGMAALWCMWESVEMGWPAISLAIAGMLCLIGFPEQNPQTGLLIALCLGASSRLRPL